MAVQDLTVASVTARSVIAPLGRPVGTAFAPSLSNLRPCFDSALISPFASVALVAAAKQPALWRRLKRTIQALHYRMRSGRWSGVSGCPTHE